MGERVSDATQAATAASSTRAVHKAGVGPNSAPAVAMRTRPSGGTSCHGQVLGPSDWFVPRCGSVFVAAAVPWPVDGPSALASVVSNRTAGSGVRPEVSSVSSESPSVMTLL